MLLRLASAAQSRSVATTAGESLSRTEAGEALHAGTEELEGFQRVGVGQDAVEGDVHKLVFPRKKQAKVIHAILFKDAARVVVA